MIQRIQSLFWLLGSIASGLMLFNPVLRINVSGGDSGLLYAGSLKSEVSGEVIISSIPLFSLVLIIVLIGLVCIFLFQKRVLQMRLTVYNMILLVGLLALGYYYAWRGLNEIGGELELTFYTIMPVIAFIFNLLAWRGVRRDYLMLKAVDRIR